MRHYCSRAKIKTRTGRASFLNFNLNINQSEEKYRLMGNVTFNLETVTPLFIAGADQKNIKNEGLRPPSLRGLLRWWFRAALGGAKFSSGQIDVKEIRDKENKIWGATDVKSKVVIRVSTTSVKTYRWDKADRGIRYLAYGVTKRNCLKGQFKIDVCFNRLSEVEKKMVTATFWLLLNLGAVGAKNRKGFGSLRIVDEMTIDGITFKTPADIRELEKYLKLNIKRCLEYFGWRGPPNRNAALPPFSIIAPSFWRMKILNDRFTSDKEAIDHIGKKIRWYREDRGNPSARHSRKIKGKLIPYWVTRDYKAVKSIFTEHFPSTPQGSIFGLPHQFQFQSIGKKAVVKGVEHERRSSPLFIKVWELNREFIVGMQLFKSQFLPKNKMQISDLNSAKRTHVDLPSYDYLEKFLDMLAGRWITL